MKSVYGLARRSPRYLLAFVRGGIDGETLAEDPLRPRWMIQAGSRCQRQKGRGNICPIESIVPLNCEGIGSEVALCSPRYAHERENMSP